MAEKMNEGDLGEMMTMVGILETPNGPVDVLILDTIDTKRDEQCEAQKESYIRRGAEYDKAWA